MGAQATTREIFLDFLRFRALLASYYEFKFFGIFKVEGLAMEKSGFSCADLIDLRQTEFWLIRDSKRMKFAVSCSHTITANVNQICCQNSQGF